MHRPVVTKDTAMLYSDGNTVFLVENIYTAMRVLMMENMEASSVE